MNHSNDHASAVASERREKKMIGSSSNLSRWFLLVTISFGLCMMLLNVLFLNSVDPTITITQRGFPGNLDREKPIVANGDEDDSPSTETGTQDPWAYEDVGDAAAATPAVDYAQEFNYTHILTRPMTWEELDAGSIFTIKRHKQNPHGMKIVPNHLPLPIFVLNMPKSGSTTIFAYFKCGMGNHFAIHHLYTRRFMDPQRVGSVNADLRGIPTCMAHNLWHDRPLVQGCGGFSVYTDAGGEIKDVKGEDDLVLDWNSHLLQQAATATNRTLLEHDHPLRARTPEEQDQLKHRSWCFYPGVHALENIAKYYPYATILHLPRNSSAWIQSVAGWTDSGKTTSRLLERFEHGCDGFEDNIFWGPFPKTEALRDDKRQRRKARRRKTDAEWKEWYERDYTGRIREFAASHPTLTYFESPLEDPETPAKLEAATGIPASCFGHSLKSTEREERFKQRAEKQQQQKEQTSTTK